MSETRWRVTLDNRASRGAKTLTRDLRELAKALREVGEASSAVGGVSVGGSFRRRGGGGGGTTDAAAQAAQRRARAAKEEARVAARVRQATERAQATNARREAAAQRADVRAQVDAARIARQIRGQRAANEARWARAETRYQRNVAGQRREAIAVEREHRAFMAAGVGTTLGVIGGITAATVTAGAAIASMVVEVGTLITRISGAVLEMIAFREASLATLRAMARDNTGQRLRGPAADAAARDQFRFAQSFARESPLDLGQVIQLQNQVSTAGFGGQTNRDVLLAAGDIGAANPNDSTAASRFVRAMGQIRSKGRLQMEELQGQLADVGVGFDPVAQAIGRRMGLRESGQALNDRVRELIRGGRVSGDVGTQAVLDAVRSEISAGGELGGLARAQGRTLLGTLSNLRGATLDFVTSIEGIEDLPGVQALKKVLNDIVAALTGSGPTATRLRAIFTALVNDAAQFVGDLGGRDGVEGIIGRAVDLFERWAPLVRDVIGAFGGAAWQGLTEGLASLGTELGAIGQDPGGTVEFARELGRDFGLLLAYGVEITAAVAALVAGLVILGGELLRVVSGVQQLIGAFSDAGTAVVDGFLGGFGARAQAALGEVSAWATDIAGAAQAALGIQSPSRVFRDEVGAQIPAGLALGIDSGARDVQRSMENITAPQGLPGFGGAQGLPGLGGGTINVAAGAIVVHGGGRDAADIADEVLDRLVGYFERPALAAA